MAHRGERPDHAIGNSPPDSRRCDKERRTVLTAGLRRRESCIRAGWRVPRKDVAFVHAGYAKWRKPLLKAGSRLYELRRAMTDSVPARPEASFGSSGANLHAKTCSIDRSRVFIGSFNFDPRSAKLNTEMGFLVESSALPEQMDIVFRSRIPMDAYEVRSSEDGRIWWQERRGSELFRHDKEPGTSVWKRAWVRFLSALPIEWLL
jgi:cardiolipin synthase C